MNIHLPHRALWKRHTGENRRGDRTYSEPVEIPCRIERRSGFERGEGESAYTRLMVSGEHRVEVSDRISLVVDDPADGDWENVDDLSEQVDISGNVVGAIIYFEGGRL